MTLTTYGQLRAYWWRGDAHEVVLRVRFTGAYNSQSDQTKLLQRLADVRRQIGKSL